MKNLIIILLLSIISNFSFGQKRLEKIKKVEDLIEKNKLNKANRLLDRVSKEFHKNYVKEYGFCGTGLFETIDAILKNYALIDYKQEKYAEALLNLNNTNSFYLSEIDSLRMQILIDWQGKEKIKKEIDKNLTNISNQDTIQKYGFKCSFSFTEIEVYFINLLPDDPECFKFRIDKNATKRQQAKQFEDIFKQSSFYKMLEDSIYTQPEIQAEVIGGNRYLLKWIRKNLIIDEKVKKMGIDLSRIWLEFIVEKDGSINNMKIANTYKDFDINNFVTLKPMNEIIYKPAYHQGKAVRSKVKFLVLIRLK